MTPPTSLTPARRGRTPANTVSLAIRTWLAAPLLLLATIPNCLCLPTAPIDPPPPTTMPFAGIGRMPNPFLPAADEMTAVTGISEDGSILVGFCARPHGRTEAIVWNGALTGLGFLGGHKSLACDVSSNGQIIVGLSERSDLREEAFRFENGSMQGLGFLPGAATFLRSVTGAVSDDGGVIVGESTNVEHRTEAFRLAAGRMQGLGFLTQLEQRSSSATAISGDGTVIAGRATDDTGRDVAVRWIDQQIETLGLLPGTLYASATALSEDGSVVVGNARHDPARTYEAFIWRHGVMSSLGGLSGAPVESFAAAVSKDGSVVLGTAKDANGDSIAIVWSESTGMRMLREVLYDKYHLDIDATGWSLLEATAISGDGRVVAGNGINPDGIREGWRLALDPALTTALAQ